MPIDNSNKENKVMKTWEELKAINAGTTVHDEMRDGIRFIVIRGPGSLCGYVGVPLSHPLAGHSYDDITVQAHGGLTFSNIGDGKIRPEGYWWYGWDYSHSGDDVFYGSIIREPGAKQWLIDDVIQDSWETIYDFQRLMKLAEEIFTKTMGWRKKIKDTEI